MHLRVCDVAPREIACENNQRGHSGRLSRLRRGDDPGHLTPHHMSEDKNVGQRVWYKVKDTDLWALCTVEKFFKGEYHLRRVR